MPEKGDKTGKGGGSNKIPPLLEQGVSVISADYVVEYQNQALIERFGDLKGKLCYEGYYGRKKSCRICALRQAIENGRSETHEVKTKDGRIYEFRFIPFRDASGAMKVTELTMDITERKETEELYRTLFTSSPTSVYIAQEGKIAFVNPQYYKLMGYGEDELLGTDPLALVHPEDRQRVRYSAVAMLKGNRSSPYEMRVINKAGETVWVVGTVSSINYKRKRATLGNFMDITEQKRVEQELMGKTKELETASQAKSDFLASMSHELRTPLNAIIGFSELMLDGVLGEIHDEQRQCLNDVLSSGQHLLNLSNDVLDLSKVEAGKIELKLESLNLADVIHNVVKTVKPMLDNNRHILTVNIEEGLPQVQADKKRLRQIFFNLLNNAIKFTPASGKLGIEVSREGDWCQVSVVDNGIGIGKKDQKRIFEPFAQIDTLSERKKEGTGLGLALTKQLVEMCGGKIWVESECRKGSQFTFTIPLTKG